MIRVERNALVDSHIAGGAAKQVGTRPDNSQPGSTFTMSGSSTTVVKVNGETVVNQTVTF